MSAPVPAKRGPPRTATRWGDDGSVRSVQWLDGVPPPVGWDAAGLERRYFLWVPRLTAGLVRARARGASLVTVLDVTGWPVLLALGPPDDGPGRRTRAILGGWLAAPGGTFSLEWSPSRSRLTVTVDGLRPRLPRSLYFGLQRRLHERASLGFLRALGLRLAVGGG